MKSELLLFTLSGFAVCRLALAEAPKPPLARNPDITTKPVYWNNSNASGGQYTEYKLKDAAARKKAVEMVRKVTATDSFVARTLRVITGNGGSKIFETITGQDGLTFGVKDFTSGGLLPLLELIEKHHPGAVKAAFSDQTHVLEKGWLDRQTSSRNDHGLVALSEVRVGLDRILCDVRFHDEQLDRFVAEAVEPTLKKFKDRKYVREFSLAAMIGAANSGGPGGLEKWLSQAEKKTGSEKEELVIPEFMRIYTMRDASGKVTATQDLLDKVFDSKQGKLPDWDSLGHSGRRLRWLAEYFSWKSGKEFLKLGSFGSP
jgi:hypothetical protein